MAKGALGLSYNFNMPCLKQLFLVAFFLPTYIIFIEEEKLWDKKKN